MKRITLVNRLLLFAVVGIILSLVTVPLLTKKSENPNRRYHNNEITDNDSKLDPNQVSIIVDTPCVGEEHITKDLSAEVNENKNEGLIIGKPETIVWPPIGGNATTNSSCNGSSITIREENNNAVWEESRKRAIVKQVQEYFKGNIAYAIPDSMFFQEESRLALSIGKKGTQPEASIRNYTITNKEADHDVKIEIMKNVSISKKVAAYMTNSDGTLEGNFLIHPLSEVKQALIEANDHIAHWRWEVTPKALGKHLLDLKAKVFVRENGEERVFDIPIATQVVNVVFSPQNKSSYYIWGGLGAGLLLLIISFFLLKNRGTVRQAQYLSEQYTNQARELIHQGKVRESIQLMKRKTQYLSKLTRNELSLHLAEYNRCQKKIGNGLIPIDEAQQILNRINYALLNLLNDLEDTEVNNA